MPDVLSYMRQCEYVCNEYRRIQPAANNNKQQTTMCFNTRTDSHVKHMAVCTHTARQLHGVRSIVCTKNTCKASVHSNTCYICQCVVCMVLAARGQSFIVDCANRAQCNGRVRKSIRNRNRRFPINLLRLTTNALQRNF